MTDTNQPVSNSFRAESLQIGPGAAAPIESVAVIGVGGVGGYFGGKLCQLRHNDSEFNISFVARGEHLRAIQSSGLLLSSEADGELLCAPTLATDDFERLPPFDVGLLCVKEFDLTAVLTALEPMIGETTILLPLLNGVDVSTRVRAMIKKGVVLPACVYVGTHIERPGKVVQKGGACKILFGPDPRQPEFSPCEIITLFNRAKIKSEWTLNVHSEIWKKFIFIAAFGLVSAAHGKVLGEILDDDELSTDALAIMREAVALAGARGVSLPNDAAEASFAKAKGFPYETKTSFQRDFERCDKPDERDLFAGTMLRMGERFRIHVPTIKAISERLAMKKPLAS